MMSGAVVSTLVFVWNRVQSFLHVPLMCATIKKDFDVDDRLAFSSWWYAWRQVRELHAVSHLLALACEHDLRAAFAIKLKGRNRYIEQLNKIAQRRRKGHYEIVVDGESEGRVRHQRHDGKIWKPFSGVGHVLGDENDAQIGRLRSIDND